jgi:5-deoxy-D-glucuronate isomerase
MKLAKAKSSCHEAVHYMPGNQFKQNTESSQVSDEPGHERGKTKNRKQIARMVDTRQRNDKSPTLA